MTSIALERRKQRSTDPLVALHYQLAQSKSASAVEAIVLADPSGMVVAGAGAWVLCEELAAYAPLFLQGPANESTTERSRPLETENGLPDRVASLRAECEVREMTANGQPVLLCAMGRSSARTRAADLAAEGVVRILEQTL
jgi:hypothetical protein